MDRSRTESKKGYRALGGLVLLVVAGCGQPGGDERIREAYARKEAEAREAKQAADERREAAVASLDWITVPGGPFKMGDNSLGLLPERRVDVDEFLIARHEVTNGEFERYVLATGAIAPFDFENGRAPAGRRDHPVRLPQIDARAYAEWLGCRLPTRAEWEKAARGTDGRHYPWGMEFDPSKCNSAHEGPGDTMPVGSFPEGASPYGCLDMVGNVSEWTDDTVSTEDGVRGVLKGGGYVHDNPRWLRCAFEYLARPVVEKNPVNGFRLAKNP